MVKKITTLSILSLFFSFANILAQQTIQLYFEDFNAGAPLFQLNNGGPGGNIGTNKWIINDLYDGNGLYPNTPDETQTVSGTIAGAPYSSYLHINDANNTATAGNANYDPNNASDRVADMGSGFCTLAMTDVTFTFFYLCEGNAGDYGQVYYSIDGGSSWTQVGQGQYNNQTLWKYEVITDPNFNNQVDLRFAFRWVNATGGTASSSFSIDDIIVVGTYDNINNPVTIDITSISPNPVCQGGYLTIFFELSAPMCEGTYEVEMSNASGSFSSPYNLGVFTVYANQTTGGVVVVIPSFVVAGSCYEVRINRVAPPPAITGSASICFEIEVCPNVITTLQPPVTFGPDTLCLHSVIDVPFYSTGVFNFNNQYVAELSDASGSFNNPTVLGSVLDPSTYDPLYGSPPGTVSGLIPTVPPGCNYYVRVVSTNPATAGSPWGPFCIHECDITTNNMEDIAVCISDNVGVDTTIEVDISTWGTGVTYGPNNEFQVQVIDPATYSILNTGSLGVVAATTSTTLTLSIPGLIQLVSILGPPGYGTYYMRLVATDVTPPSQNLGTLVHLTIGAPDSIPPLIIPDDTLICANVILGITIIPFDYYSQYQWYSPNVNGGSPFFWDYNPLLINFAGAPAGTYWFTVREFNNGCWGPWSDTIYIDVISTPSVNIIGPVNICLGDTLTYYVPFLPGTYYEWTTTWGDVIDTSNNEITVVFDSIGTATLGVFALNECGSASGTKNLSIHELPTLTAPPDTSLCPGAELELNATSNTSDLTWSADGATVSTNNPVTVTPLDSSTTYVVLAQSNFGCEKYDTTIVQVFPGMESDITSVDVTCEGINDGQAAVSVGGGTQPFVYDWNTEPSQTTDLVTGLAPGDYTVIVTDANGCADSASVTIIEPTGLEMTVTSTGESHYNAKDGTATATVSGGTSPYSYSWSTIPEQTTSTATNLEPGIYIITVTDANGCKAIDTVEIETATNAFAVPNAFTPNGDGLNDIFQVVSVNIASIDIQVFNRWGQLVYFSNDLNEGWDGTFEGKNEQNGTYVYYIRANFFDGTSDVKKGNVTLLR